MPALALDSTSWDLSTDGDRLTLLQGPAATAQSVKANLQTLRGTWPTDEGRGVDWLAKGTKPAPLALLRAQMAQEILRTRGVTALDSLTLEPNNSTRALTVTASIRAQAQSVNVALTLGPSTITDPDLGALRGRFPLWR